MEDGLPLSHLNTALAARDGYLWLASFDGIIRFDGVRFTVFNTASHGELPTNRFTRIVEGPDDAIWALAEFDHLVRLAGERFEVFTLPAESRGGAMRRLRFDRAGTPWVSTTRGVFTIGERGLVPIAPLAGVSGGSLHFDAAGAAWLATDGRAALRLEGETVRDLRAGDSPLDRVATSFAEPHDGTVLIGTGNGVLEYRQGRLARVAGPAGEGIHVRALLELPGDTILIVADTGLFDLVDGRSRSRNPAIGSDGWLFPSFVMGLDGERWLGVAGRLYRDERLVHEGAFPVGGLAVDHEGSLWMAADGLHRFKPASFEVRGDEDGGFSNVYPIFEASDGRTWVGGLSRGTGFYEGDRFHALDRNAAPTLAQAFAEDAVGRIWVGQINYGGCILERLECLSRNRFLLGHTVKAIFRDRADNMWIGTDRGVYRDSAGGRLHLSTADGLPHDFVRVIHQSADGAMWFGMNGGGVARYADGRLTPITTAEGLSSDLVRSLYEDSAGVMWAGTEDGGLNRIALVDLANGAPTIDIRVVDRERGLYDDGIHTIVPDGFGRLWMSTNRGIFWVLASELEDAALGRVDVVHPVSYTERDGLRNREANGGVQSAAIRASDGRLWFAMQSGVAIVDPSDMERSRGRLPVRIEELRVEGGRTVTAANRDPAGLVSLAAGERDFQVAYTALSFLAPENLRFQYRLVGFQDEWVEAANRRTAFFTNVPAGRYDFEVRATRGDGEWVTAGEPLRLRVRPFVYETTWFKVSLAGGLLALGITGVRVRDRRHRTRERELSAIVAERTATVEAQSARLKEIDRAKSRFFANISHEFRTPLTLTIGPLEDLASGFYGELDGAASEPVALSLRNSRRLLRLVNQLMDVAKLEAGAVELRVAESDLVAFARSLTQAFEPLAERLSITTAFEGPDRPVRAYFDPELFERVLMNLLSNAFKFTPAGGAVRVVVTDDDDGWASVAVRDSGRGIPPEQRAHLFERFYQGDPSSDSVQPGTGIGLSLARELVELHGGTIDVESTPGFGSEFTVRLRLGTAHLDASEIAAGGGLRTPSGAKVDEEMALFDPGEDGSGDERGALFASPAFEPGRPTDDSPTILIVEDNAEVASYIRRHLEERFRCAEARDGVDALRVAREVLPDVVVSDVMMPRMGGLELLDELRGDRDLAYVPVLLLTAKADQEHKIEGLEAGAADYLTKPFDVAELEARVVGLIEHRRRLKERFRHEALLGLDDPEIETADDRFVVKLRNTIQERLADEDFHVRELARAMSESRSSLYRHVVRLTGQTPSELIRTVRLERAALILKAGGSSIQEVAYAVGFKSVSHFSRSFREEYGVSPSRYPADE